MNIHDKQLTHEQMSAEFDIEDMRVKHLDSVLASMSRCEETKLLARLKQTVDESIRELCRKLPRWNIIPLTSTLPPRIGLYLLTSEEARHYFCRRNRKVASGMAWRERSTIGLINHLALAPKEVIKCVAVHEYLHILYPLSIKEDLEVRNSIKTDYPLEYQQEEEWVSRMTERLCGKDDLLLAWEIAVEARGLQWKDAYYNIKKLKIVRPQADLFSIDAERCCAVC